MQVDEQATDSFENRESAGGTVDKLLVAVAKEAFHYKDIAFAWFKPAFFKQGVNLVKIVTEFKNGFDAAMTLAGAN
jgi:hypothetical protein